MSRLTDRRGITMRGRIATFPGGRSIDLSVWGTQISLQELMARGYISMDGDVLWTDAPAINPESSHRMAEAAEEYRKRFGGCG